jgi:hypothetical protein
MISCRAAIAHRALILLGINVDAPTSTKRTRANATRTRSGAPTLRRINQPRFHIPRQAEEGLLDVRVGFCGRLDVFDAQLRGELLCLRFCDDALLVPVALVADEDLGYAFACVLLDVRMPCPDVCAA